MSERIELWATVRNGCVHAYYRDPDLAARMRHRGEQIVHLVELRDGEPHPDETAKTIAALTERAEKAEQELADIRAEIDDWFTPAQMRAKDETIAERDRTIEDLRTTITGMWEAHRDERARFERECGMRFRAAGIGRWGDEAQWMAAFYFGAKEAGNG